MLILLEKCFKALFVIGLLISVWLYFIKDTLPTASFYDTRELRDPIQTPTRKDSFTTRVNGETYIIKPLYDYELDGVIVSYHNADDVNDIWHHARWRDFINLRDLCVVWGKNVESEVYLDMEFHNDSWTCWFSWPNAEVRKRFQMDQISNNHVLIDDELVKTKLMQSEPGDQIWLKGYLAEYSNPGNGFHRSTSTIRTDTGNGACETIYVTDFELVKKSNPQLRLLYSVSYWTTVVSLIGFLILFVAAPYRGRYAA